MSGGIIALRGFDYQATVILDLLFTYFEKYKHNVTVRPEGEDDLDIRISDHGITQTFIQIKKPREDSHGAPSPQPWTLSDAIEQLFPNTIRNLRNPHSIQHWVVGDTFSQDIERLVSSGESAPIQESFYYWDTVHRLGKNKLQCGKEDRKKINKIKLKESDTSTIKGVNNLTDVFKHEAKKRTIDKGVIDSYATEVFKIHSELPSALKRIVLCPMFGKEEEVVSRVKSQLKVQYKIPEKVSQGMLFRNLRGFINDISKQYNKTFCLEDFESELASVWPRIIHVCQPPPKPAAFIDRPDVVKRFLSIDSSKTVEIVGISGSGKSLFVSDILDYLRANHQQRLAFYSEVRAEENISLRDVLCGLSFILRRYGEMEAFSIAIEQEVSEEYALQRLAEALSNIALPVTLFIDFVSGKCPEQFARDLASFLRTRSKGQVQLVLLSQDRSLRLLSPVEQQYLNITQFFIPGFTKEEFIALAQMFNQDTNSTLASEVYDKLSAGRDSGLRAASASLLASRSVEELKKIALQPSEEMLPVAERLRFSSLPDTIFRAAEKLACFMLPFTKEDATEAFPDTNIGLAIAFLLDNGLLQPTHNDSYEMHEMVRKGILSLINPKGVTESHKKLAEWYHDKPVARTHHLLQAGEKEKADRYVREEFFRSSWYSLIDYVCDNNLLTTEDVYAAIKNRSYPTSCPLAGLLKRLGVNDTTPLLLELAFRDKEYFNTDFNWSMNLGREIAKHSLPDFFTLLTMTIEYAKEHPENEHTALDWAYLFLEREGVFRFPEDYLQTVKNEEITIQKRLIPLVLRDKRRENITLAIELREKEEASDSFMRKRSAGFPLHIDSVEDVVEFLASIPYAEGGRMMAIRTVFEGWIGEYVWTNKDQLSLYCKKILAVYENREIPVIKNALRVLIHVADADAIRLAQPFIKKGHALHGFSALLPVFFPQEIDIETNKKLLLDQNTAIFERLTPLTLLAAAGGDLNELYATLKSQEPEKHEQIDFMFSHLSVLQQCGVQEALLTSCEKIIKDDNAYPPIAVAQFAKLLKSPSKESLEILVRALDHKSPEIRTAATTFLSQKRSSKALPHILKRLNCESVEAVAVGLVVAAASSGLSSISQIKNFLQNEAVLAWKCKLAGRLQDASSEAISLLVETALNTEKHWEVRRAAVLASAHLPFEAALKHFYLHILKESSPLVIDTSTDLIAHSHLRDILLKEGRGVLSTYMKGEKYFVTFWGSLFDECWSQATFTYDIPKGESISAWLYHRLQQLDFPNGKHILDRMLWELSTPYLHDAVLRALASTRQYDCIEKAIADAPNIWTTIRAVCTRIKAGNFDDAARDRLVKIADASPYRNAGHGILYRVIRDDRAKPETSGTNEKPIYIPKFAVCEFDCCDPISKIEGLDTGATFVAKAQSVEDVQNLWHRIEKKIEDKHDVKRTPQLKMKADGEAVIRHTTTYSGGGLDFIENKIIPSLSACFATFGVIPDWHDEKMKAQHSDTYMFEYAKCLAVLENKDFFYEQIASNEKLLLCVLKNHLFFISHPKLITERIFPLVYRYVNVSTPKMFEGICALICQVKTSNAVVPLLASLLRRWAKEKASVPFEQNDRSISLARAFNQLSAHPNFYDIPDWLVSIGTVLQAGVRWYEKKELLKIMGRHPEAYSQIEAELLHITIDQHFIWDEIDELDQAAQKLFKQATD